VAKTKNIIVRMGTRLIEVLDDFCSFKVEFSLLLFYLAYKSNWDASLTIIAGINALFLLWIREIQKPNSNLAKILEAWFGRGIKG